MLFPPVDEDEDEDEDEEEDEEEKEEDVGWDWINCVDKNACFDVNCILLDDDEDEAIERGDVTENEEVVEEAGDEANCEIDEHEVDDDDGDADAKTNSFFLIVVKLSFDFAIFLNLELIIIFSLLTLSSIFVVVELILLMTLSNIELKSLDVVSPFFINWILLFDCILY